MIGFIVRETNHQGLAHLGQFSDLTFLCHLEFLVELVHTELIRLCESLGFILPLHNVSGYLLGAGPMYLPFH